MRLTIKCENNYYPNVVFEKNRQKMLDMTKQLQCNNKLGQLEDIEEELGIELLTMAKIVKEGVWCEKNDKHYELSYFDFKKRAMMLRLLDDDDCLIDTTYVWFKDYGKTWALTRKELL